MRTYAVVRFTVAGAAAPALDCAECYTLIYDGYCRVCTRIATVLRAWDKGHKLQIVTSQAPGVQARFPWIPAVAYTESVQLIAPSGQTWQGAAAVEEILRVLPKGKLIAWVFTVPGVRRVAERFYRWFARNRYRLGCGDHCQYKPAHLNYEDGTD